MEPDLQAKDDMQDSTCKVCKKKFKSPEKLSLHMRFHSLFGNFKKSPPASDCSMSEEVGEPSTILQKTLTEPKPKSRSTSILLVEKPFRCAICGSNFSSMRNKMQHDLLHAKKTAGIEQRGAYTTEIKCSICKQRCRTEGGLQTHFQTCHTNLPFSCEKCSKKFKTKRLLRSHSKNIHNDFSDDNEDAAVDTWNRNKNGTGGLKSKYESIVIQKKNQSVLTYKCRVCGKLCFTLKSVAGHMRKMHKTARGGDIHAGCLSCGKFFKNHTLLKRHTSALHKNGLYKCLTCNASFDSELRLCEHEKDAHKQSDSYKCEKCDATFDNSSSLKTHLKSSHSLRSVFRFQQKLKGYKRFRIQDKSTGVMAYGLECLICQKRFKSTNSIIVHIKEEHNGSGSDKQFQDSLPKDNTGKAEMKNELANGVCEGSSNTTPKGTKVNDKKDAVETGRPSAAITTIPDCEVMPVEEKSIPNSTSTTKAEESRPVPTTIAGSESESKLAEPEAKKKKRNASEGLTPKASSDTSKRKSHQRRSFFGAKPRPKTKSTDPCRCLDCEVVLKTEWALEQHYKNKHSGTNYEIVPRYSSRNGKYNLYIKCLICGKTCRSKGSLRLHLKEHKRKNEDLVKEGTPIKEDSTDAVEAKEKAAADEPVKRKRKRGSCIYHCRVCGKSFPRLYHYNEHDCSGKAPTDNEENADRNCNITSNKNKKQKISAGKVHKQNERIVDVSATGLEHKIKIKQEVIESDINLDGHSEHAIIQLGAATSRKEPVNETFSRLPLDASEDHQLLVSGGNFGAAMQSQQNVPKLNVKRSKINSSSVVHSNLTDTSAKLQSDQQKTPKRSNSCQYCKMVFRNASSLAKHVLKHSLYKGHVCNNCGDAFSAPHKLRYHSMRCNPRQTVDNKMIDGNSKPSNTHVEDGLFEGKTYPSFASKREYTVFDPANKSPKMDINHNIEVGFHEEMLDNLPINNCTDPHNQQPESYTYTSFDERSCSNPSALDDIQIADVRSCHPSFSSTKCNTVVDKATNNYFPSDFASTQGPAYIVGPPGQVRGFPLQPGYQFNMMQQFSPSPELYPNGTVFFVPYFVPARANAPEYFGKRVNSGSRIIAKSAGSMQEGQTYPLNSEVICPAATLIDPTQPSPVVNPDSNKDSWLQGRAAIAWQESCQKNKQIGSRNKTDSLQNHDSSAENGSEKKLNVSHATDNCRYECSFCQQKFHTFGNFVKHRESHR